MRRCIKIYEIGDPESCPGCRKMEAYLKDLSRQYLDVSFVLFPFLLFAKIWLKM